MRKYALPAQYEPDHLGRIFGELIGEIEQLEAEVAILKNPPDRVWMTPQEVEQYSGGKYTADEVIAVCKRVMEFPAELPLRIGDRIKFTDNGRGRFFKVHYPEFDRVMVMEMKNRGQKNNAKE